MKTDQTGRIPRLMGIFSGCAKYLVVLMSSGSIKNRHTLYGKHQAYMGHVMRKPVYAICEQKSADEPARACSLISTFVIP